MQLVVENKTASSSPNHADRSGLLYWSGVALVLASWISSAAFGLYIWRFYLGAAHAGHLARWNENLSGLYDPHHLVAVLAMGAHMATGAILLLLGPVQLISAVRQRHGRARRLQAHRAWSVRLFALAIGSWLYRMDYGFWLLAMHRLGHRSDFHGAFDVVMAFWFYVPNLLLAELYLRGTQWRSNPAYRIGVAVALNAATLVVAVGTYYFTRFYWGPAILHGAG